MLRWLSRHLACLHRLFQWIVAHTLMLQFMAKWIGKRLTWLRYINPLRYIKRLDWYIIKKFIGTYIYSIALIISISIVIDINENLAKFSEYHAPLKAIVFDYYMNFIPYFANLFSPLFVFIAVIFFTSVSCWCVIQKTHATLHDLLYSHFSCIILSQWICHST